MKVALPRSLKLAGEAGTFSGYGSVFGVEDSYGEIVAPGAFTASLAEIKQQGRSVPILWQHDPGTPIGKWTNLKQDATGLSVEGQLLVEDVAQAREAQALMKAGVVSGLSIGFYARASSFDEVTGVRTLTQVDLVEVSVVTFPANAEARVSQVKHLGSRAEVEDILHKAGVPRTAARKLAAGGWGALVADEDEQPAPDPFLEILLRKLDAATRDLKSL